jgi:HEAT repeat protein
MRTPRCVTTRRITRPGAGGLVLVGLLVVAAPAEAQPPAGDQQVRELGSPSTRARIDALRQLGDAARSEAAVPMAAALLDGNDDVQFAAVESLLKLYTVRADLAQRHWGVTATGRTSTFPEVAFEAGPLGTIPAAVPAEVLVNLASVMRRDESGKIRLSAAYALGVLGSPDMGPMAAAAAPSVVADTVYALTHPVAATRQVVARVAGRVFEPVAGQTAPAAVGDALIAAMNDKNAQVRWWAMESLGILKYERAVQSLTDRASYYGKDEGGIAAVHALARIANTGSAPVLRSLLASAYTPFRLLAIEGLGRIGDKDALPQIGESEAGVTDPGVPLAADFARFLMGQADLVAVADAIGRPVTAVQARVYLAEIARTNPAALHPLLKTPDLATRRAVVEMLGASRHPSEAAALELLLRDPSQEVLQAVSEAIRRLRALAAVTGQA